MIDERIFENEKFSDEKLEKVVGGSLREISEICSLVKRKFNVGLGFYDVPDYLKKNYGINVKISGDPYTLNPDEENVYSINGEVVTHKQVIDIINAINAK
ncbi:MAG: hypothetical protein IK062_06495 [Selenomonadaceae bacterium]|nr:hypothetical protein [Selenomonadaceae bacterium]